MPKLMFLLCVAFAINTNRANYTSSRKLSYPVGRDSLLECTCTIAVEKDYYDSDLLQKISITKKRFKEVYDELYQRSSYFLNSEQNHIFQEKNDLVDVMSDIFFEKSKKWRKHYMEIPTECRAHAVENEYFRKERSLIVPCWEPIQSLLDYPLTSHLIIYRDVLYELMGLPSEVFTCHDRKCSEIVKSLEDLKIDEKLEQLITMVHYRVDQYFPGKEDLDHCLNVEKTREQYEKDVINDTVNVLNCYESNKASDSSNSVAGTNTPLVAFDNFYYPLNADLASKVNATKTRLRREWRNLWDESKKVYLEHQKEVNAAVPHLVSELKNIFHQDCGNEMKNYEKETKAKDCFVPIKHLYTQIYRHDIRASKCQIFAIIDHHQMKDASSIFESLGYKISKLDRAAFDCRDESCVIGVQKELNYLEREFEELDKQLPLFIKESNTKLNDFHGCLKLNSTLHKYNENVKDDCINFKLCVEQNLK